MNIVRIYPLIIHVRKSTKQLNIYVLDVLEAHIIPMWTMTSLGNIFYSVHLISDKFFVFLESLKNSKGTT